MCVEQLNEEMLQSVWSLLGVCFFPFVGTEFECPDAPIPGAQPPKQYNPGETAISVSKALSWCSNFIQNGFIKLHSTCRKETDQRWELRRGGQTIQRHLPSLEPDTCKTAHVRVFRPSWTISASNVSCWTRARLHTCRLWIYWSNSGHYWSGWKWHTAGVPFQIHSGQLDKFHMLHRLKESNNDVHWRPLLGLSSAQSSLMTRSPCSLTLTKWWVSLLISLGDPIRPWPQDAPMFPREQHRATLPQPQHKSIIRRFSAQLTQGSRKEAAEHKPPGQ